MSTTPFPGGLRDPVTNHDAASVHSARVLMVDDEPSTLDVIGAFLQEAGYRNITATSEPRKALEQMVQEQPDVVLLDLVMPEISGFDIIRTMRNDSRLKHIPIIVLTSFAGPEMKIKALELGASDFLAKPVDSSELALRLRNTLATKAYLDRLKLALDNSGLALWDFDVHADRIYLSEQWQSMLGCPARASVITRKALEEIIFPDDLPRLLAHLQDVREGLASGYDIEYRARTHSGDWIWVRSIGKVVERDDTGDAVRITGTNSDITARKHAEMELAHQATHDALTGLPNRSLLLDRLERAMIRCHRTKKMMAVMYVDIDRFKNINDTLGHDMGDALLKAFAHRLAGCMRESDTVARIGGDEFTLVVEELTRREIAANLAQKILAAMRVEFSLGERAIAISASIGVAHYAGEHDVCGDEIIRNADRALYAAKKNGRDQYSVAG
ncbi:MAG: diguanylate cyclase domain-containing protein [Betaproteobacteria bacterium]